MYRYMEFKTDKFLLDSRRWENEKNKLLEEMESLAELERTGSNGRASGISDSTALAVIKRERIQRQIDRLDVYQQAFTYAWNNLSDTSKDVLTALILTDGAKLQAVSKYAEKCNICVNEVYKLRRESLAELHDLIAERYDI